MLRTLLLIPSFYGASLFAIAFALYEGNGGLYEDSSPGLSLICAVVILAFTLATVVSIPRFARCAKLLLERPAPIRQGTWRIIALLHLIGLLGIALYFRALVEHFGSPLAVMLRLVYDSAAIRIAAPDVHSVGIQISYLGWLAIWLTAVTGLSRKGKWILAPMSAIQLAANLLFIDRTRPIWILFVGMLLLALKHFGSLKTKRLLIIMTVGGVCFISLFIVIGAWVGKVNASSGIDAALKPVYIYITSGFAYFNRVLLLETPDMTLARSLYPLWTIGAHFGIVAAPPSQINAFIYTPIPTNVGTFLEPLYRDGGLGLVLVGIALHAFGFNWLGVRLLRRQSVLCSIAWAILCFTDAIAFFVPKYASAPAWLFVGLGVWALWWSRTTESSPQVNAMDGSDGVHSRGRHGEESPRSLHGIVTRRKY